MKESQFVNETRQRPAGQLHLLVALFPLFIRHILIVVMLSISSIYLCIFSQNDPNQEATCCDCDLKLNSGRNLALALI